MQMEATPCLVREQRFNPKTLGLHATRRVCCGHSRHHIQWSFRAFGPATEEQKRAIGGFGHAGIPQRAEGARLDTGRPRLAPEALAVPRDGTVAARPDAVSPVIPLEGVRERRAIALAVAPYSHLRPWREQCVDLLDQGAMEGFGEMSFLALAHQPCEWEGSSCIGHMHHQRPAAAPDNPAIHDQYPRLPGERTQQALRIRDNIGVLRDGGGPYPPGKACDAALRLGTIGPVGSDFG